jgi:hypothetical protein
MKTLEPSRVAWFGLVCVLFCLVTISPGAAHAQWTSLTNPLPPGLLTTCLLLTDGHAMCHQYNTNQWWRLIPDIFGSYANGTWSATAPMPNGTDTSGSCAPCVYAPLYYASAVLPDGRVVVVGGEYNSNRPVWTNIGFLYNPVTDTWSSQLVVPFPTGIVGDIQTVILENGTMLIASIGTNIAEFDPTTLTFTALNPINKLDNNNEENWNILPNGRVFTVDTRIANSFEIYDPGSNTWTSGTTAVNLVDCCGAANGVGSSLEAGPGVLRPDGTLVYFSANSTGQNAVYDTVAGTWTHTAAMDFPLVPGQTYHFAVADGPASLLPNGNVLVMASPVRNGSPFNTPSHFYEFDGTNLTQVTDSPNAASLISFLGRMLLLPSGEVLLTANNGATQDVLLYSNGGSPQNAWRPVITAAPSTVTAGNTYAISGRLFNGFSEGAAYGDDAAMSSNYPLVRIKNLATSHVVYARTHDHTSMGVDLVGSLAVVTTQFDVPAGIEAGESELVVVVNGIPSLPITVNKNLADNAKVAICHKPGTPAQKTLVIPFKALKGHLGHGDTKGPCQ